MALWVKLFRAPDTTGLERALELIHRGRKASVHDVVFRGSPELKRPLRISLFTAGNAGLFS